MMNGILMNIDDLIGAEGGEHLDLVIAILQGEVMLQRIERIVGGADDLDARGADQLSGRKAALCHFCGAKLIDLVCVFLGQRLVDIKIALQLQMRPMIERVSDGVGECLCKGTELVLPIGVSRYVVLVDAKGAHSTPLVVVARQHQLADVGEAQLRQP